MNSKTLFITPPFTQLNTPYPATAYLKGYLNTLNYESTQLDLGIEVILKLFSQAGLSKLFETSIQFSKISENAKRIFLLKNDYLNTIDPVIQFLQNNNSTLAHSICSGEYLPEASRFNQIEDLEWAFGTLGIQDKARHLSTLYLEDLSDYIKEVIDPHFGFSRYAERLGLSATSFDLLYSELSSKNSFIDDISLSILNETIINSQPDIVCISVPFPGNLYGALKCGQFIKSNYPEIKIALGGGYANTELRSLKDVRLFEFVDFITLDDGERPVQNLIEYIEGERNIDQLKRTFINENNEVTYINGSNDPDVKQSNVGTPDYYGLPIKKYLSVIEVANPMHRLWNDGRWNKLTLAHGCYWGKCTFCDISLDYIKVYEQSSAQLICDRIEELIEQTGENGFHFVDEAAPPALMREVALEIIRRNLTVVWWTNIRFEKSFSKDLCLLLKASGCIAVSGGLEVASDRLLKLIDKGVSVQQVAQVTNNFTEAGIMVHAYLMYGFPTQTVQETIDSLEMVRQLFEIGIVHSGFWHQFAMTAHSPIGLDPEKFKVSKIGPVEGDFANNDLSHNDFTGIDHTLFSEGLKKSLFNYMHGLCFDFSLQEWFDFTVPKSTISKSYIEDSLGNNTSEIKPNAKVIWLGNNPSITAVEKKKKGKRIKKQLLQFENKANTFFLELYPEIEEWMSKTIFLDNRNRHGLKFDDWKKSFTGNTSTLEQFFSSSEFHELKENGLLFV